MRKKLLIALVATLMLTVGLMLAEVPQAKACGTSKFSLEVTPTTAEEGGSVHITVRVDAGASSGDVYIETVDETAKTGKDYTGIPRQRAVPSGSNSRQFTVPITNDPATEPAETFKVSLDDPGCPYTAGTGDTGTYVLPAPVTVTIAANEAASAPPQTSPISKKSRSLVASPASPASPSALEGSASPSAQAGTTGGIVASNDAPVAESPGPLSQTGGKSRDNNQVVLVAVFAALVAGGAGFVLWKIRRT